MPSEAVERMQVIVRRGNRDKRPNALNTGLGSFTTREVCGKLHNISIDGGWGVTHHYTIFMIPTFKLMEIIVWL